MHVELVQLQLIGNPEMQLQLIPKQQQLIAMILLASLDPVVISKPNVASPDVTIGPEIAISIPDAVTAGINRDRTLVHAMMTTTPLL